MSYPNYIEYLANRRIYATIKKEVQMASQTVINQMQQLFVSTSSSAIVAQASANTAANHVTTIAAHAATASASAAEAAAIAQEIYNGNYGNGNQALIEQIEYLASLSSSAFAAANSATSTATAATSAATAAANSAAAAAAIAQEIYNGNYGNGNQALIDKIEYLFGMFYHSDSETIMENYPLFL